MKNCNIEWVKTLKHFLPQIYYLKAPLREHDVNGREDPDQKHLGEVPAERQDDAGSAAAALERGPDGGGKDKLHDDVDDDDEGGEVVGAHHALLEEGEEDGGAEVGGDGARHSQVGARDEPLHEGRHGVVCVTAAARCLGDNRVAIHLTSCSESSDESCQLSVTLS